MPAPDRIAALLAREIAAVTQALISGGSVERWERQMMDAIARGHAAADRRPRYRAARWPWQVRRKNRHSRKRRREGKLGQES